MYNETYQEYIRSILGYPTTKNFENTYNYSYMQNDNIDIEKYYPEIYKLINPMICKKCNENDLPITKELIENMTNDIYFAIESDNQININITLQNNLKQTNNIGKPIIKQTNNEKKESSNQRVIKNPTLRDLIKILIIKKLLYEKCNNTNFIPIREELRTNRFEKPPIYFNQPYQNNFSNIYEDIDY